MNDMWDKLEELFDCGVPKGDIETIEIEKVVLLIWGVKARAHNGRGI